MTMRMDDKYDESVLMILMEWYWWCLCSWLGYAKIVQVLLKHGADVHALNNLMRTPLHCNAENGRVDVANLLLSYKAGCDYMYVCIYLTVFLYSCY
jgi:hypothetical protein